MRNLDCKDIKALLSPLIDDMADSETRHAAERHLADCSACRSLIDEAETNDALVASDLDALVHPLPTGFEEAVLQRTVYRNMPRSSFSSWVTWLGWVAAAAALTLAVTIFMFDRQLRALSAIPDQARLGPGRPMARPDYLTGGQGRAASWQYAQPELYRSFTYEGPLPSGTYTPDRTTIVDSRPSPSATDRVLVPVGLIDAPPLLDPLPAHTVPARLAPPAVSREDAETFSSAALLMRMLGGSDLRSFADAEQIRQIAEYDELPRRLAAARTRLPEDDRQVVLVAESVLARLIIGPLSMDDLRVMRDTAQQMELDRLLAAMSDRWVPTDTL